MVCPHLAAPLRGVRRVVSGGGTHMVCPLTISRNTHPTDWVCESSVSGVAPTEK